MTLYSRDDERTIRQQRMADDWVASELLLPSQREQFVELQVDLRRTNRFLRITLFIFGFMIVNAVTGLVAVMLDFEDDSAATVLALVAAGAFFLLAQWMVKSYRLYRFGIEEAAVVASVSFLVIGFGLLANQGFSGLLAFVAGAAGSFVVFSRFGYVYAGVVAVVFAAVIPFNLDFVRSDTARRMISAVVLLVIFGLARERRKDHDWEFPGDSYGVLETTAWIGLYLLANLKVSSWVSIDDGYWQFYWATYIVIWILPAIGLFLAVRDRHRWMLDANIAMALITMMSNKEYLGAEQKPWDPIVFGLLLIGIAVGLKRWLSSGPDGSRRGFIAQRLLASERERLSAAGGAAALVPGAPSPHSHPAPEIGDGGRSGGAGASSKF